MSNVYRSGISPKVTMKKSRLLGMELENARIKKLAEQRLAIAESNLQADKLQSQLSEKGKEASQINTDIEKMLDSWFDPTKLPPYGGAQQGPRMLLAAACVRLASFIHPAYKHIPSSSEAMRSLSIASHLELFIWNTDSEESAGNSRFNGSSGQWNEKDDVSAENRLAGFDTVSTQQMKLRQTLAPDLDFCGKNGKMYRMCIDCGEFIAGLSAAIGFLKTNLDLHFESSFDELIMAQIQKMVLDQKADRAGFKSNASYLYDQMQKRQVKAAETSSAQLAEVAAAQRKMAENL